MTPLAAHAHVVVRTPGDAVILVRRVRQGRVYYIVPGTEVLAGETPGVAAARAAATELCLEVAIDEMVHAQTFAGVDHFFFIATTSADLPQGRAVPVPDHDDWELESELDGSYEIVQLPRTTILAHDVRPWALARRIARARSAPGPNERQS
jgi:8-oxo-dGTP diphosphatase